MTKPNGADLTFGLRRGAITGRWIWGARAIYHGGAVIDIPYDRQSHVGDITERDVKAVNGALDALPAAEAERVRRHLTECDACQARLEEEVTEGVTTLSYHETATLDVVHDEWLVERDCVFVGLEPWASRPGVVTPDPRLVLAGDTVRCDLPVALMERAATTGWTAANRLLAGWGVSGHTLYTVPVRGRSPVLRRLAQRGTG